MGDYYCDICYKTFKQKSKTKHLKSKNHSDMNTYVRNLYCVGDVYWGDFEKILFSYVEANRMKFPIFKMLIECELYGESVKFQSSLGLWWCSLLKLSCDHRFCVDKKIQNYIRLCAAKMKKELSPKTIIKNLSITFDSYYYIMAPKYRLQQPRRILESMLLKHISKLDDLEKKNKYGFLSHIYGLVNMDDITMYNVYCVDDYLT